MNHTICVECWFKLDMFLHKFNDSMTCCICGRKTKGGFRLYSTLYFDCDHHHRGNIHPPYQELLEEVRNVGR